MKKTVAFTLRLENTLNSTADKRAKELDMKKNEYISYCISKETASLGDKYVNKKEMLSNLMQVVVIANQLSLSDKDPLEVEKEICRFVEEKL